MATPGREGVTLGYCTNVHPGCTLDKIKDQLDRHARAVDALVAKAPGQSSDDSLPIGLWLPASVAGPLAGDADAISAFRDFLEARNLRVFTVNGFPFGDFHSQTVKHRVYRPAWSDPARLRYTLDLARVLAGLVPDGDTACISTLPLGWRSSLDNGDIEASAAALRQAARALEKLRDDTGRTIRVALEPEPGCTLHTTEDVVAFFERYLPETRDRAFLGVCHDVCHAAVMFEDQRSSLAALAEAGIRVDKVQISSAIRAGLADGNAATLHALSAFVEPRYLHQTALGDREGRRLRLFDDLPTALEGDHSGAAELRVHFHVPVYLDAIETLGTTQANIAPAIKAARELHTTPDFEIETYAWHVLPRHLQRGALAAGIADELAWSARMLEGNA